MRYEYKKNLYGLDCNTVSYCIGKRTAYRVL